MLNNFKSQVKISFRRIPISYAKNCMHNMTIPGPEPCTFRHFADCYQLQLLTLF